MPYRKTYKRRRNYGSRKRAGATRKAKRNIYNKRRRTGARSQNRSGFSGLPMQVGNYSPQKGLYRLTFRDTISCYPEDDTLGTAGAFTLGIAASCPNMPYYLASSSYHLGQWRPIDQSNTNGANAQCSNAFRDFAAGFVKYAKIELVATPSLTTQDDWKWATESHVFLTLSKEASPWCNGTTVASLSDQQTILSGRNTVTGITSKQTGGPAKGCKLTGVFNPKRLFNSRDLEDRSAFDFVTAGDYTSLPTAPTNSAYWNIVIVPKAPYYDKAGVGWTMGVPLPHRIDIKITYIVEMITPVASPADNAPLGPID